MNWFSQNRWLGTFLIGFGVALIAALYFLFSAKSSSNEAQVRFQEAITEKNRLERLDPFPSEANFRKMKQHLENYGATLNKLKEELKARVPSPPPLAPNEFQGRLRQSMLATAERARAKQVKLPDNFALGFDEYTAALPTTTAAPLLGQELTQIESLLNLVIDAIGAPNQGGAIMAFNRKPLADERGAAAATPAPGPSPKAPAAPGATPTGPELIQRGVVDLTFASMPSATRKVLNQIVSSPAQFYIVRTLHVRNEKDKGPAREQPVQAGSAGAATQPAPATKPTPAGALNFIVGTEHIETSARVELITFNFQ